MNTITYTTSGVCSKKITFTVENNIVTNVSFKSGCNGNSQGISRLVEGMSVAEVIKRLRGISCSGKETSCPDQLAKALEEFIQKNDGSAKAV